MKKIIAGIIAGAIIVCAALFMLNGLKNQSEDDTLIRAFHDEFGDGSISYITLDRKDGLTYNDLHIGVDYYSDDTKKLWEMIKWLEEHIFHSVGTRFDSVEYVHVYLTYNDIANDIRFSNCWLTTDKKMETPSDKRLDHLKIIFYNGTMEDMRAFSDCRELLVDRIDDLSTDADFSAFKELEYLEIHYLADGRYIDDGSPLPPGIIGKIQSTLPEGCVFEHA